MGAGPPPAGLFGASLVGGPIGISRDDKTIVTVFDGLVRRWSTASVLAAGVGGHPRPLSSFQAHPERSDETDWPGDVLSLDGTLLAGYAGSGRTVTVWSTATGRVVARIDGTGVTNDAPAGLFSPVDRVLAVSGDNELGLWDVSAAAPRRLRDVSGSALFQLAFTPQDDVVIARRDGSVIRLVDGATGRRLAVLPVQADNLLSENYVAVSLPAGLTAVANYPDDGWVTVSSAASGQVLARLPPPHTTNLEGLSIISGLAFSLDGKTLAILAYADGPARLWHVPATAPR